MAGPPGRATIAAAHRARLPVICVGNFTAGGTGKTPLAIYLCEHLKAAGHEPVALTRGYGGRLAGPYWVNAGTDRARDVGDEALLLARVAPTLLAREPPAGRAGHRARPTSGHGHCHGRWLAKPDARQGSDARRRRWPRGLGNGRVMPAGPLRASFDLQLELTDGVVVNGPSRRRARVADWLRHRFVGPVLRATPVRRAMRLAKGRASWLGPASARRSAFSPARALGAELIESVAFRDHQSVHEADADRLLALAEWHHARSSPRKRTRRGLPARPDCRRAWLRPRASCRSRLAFEEADAVRLAGLL